MSDRDLIALGFSRGNDGVLVAPKDSRVTLAPIGQFYELRISMDGGVVVIAVLSKSAVKITREATPTEPEIDPSALITGTSRRGRPW